MLKKELNKITKTIILPEICFSKGVYMDWSL